ncbi:MFS transporter [Bacillus sp. FJAT-50079]|uniref:MFS transporter n=1 Tax=Bacillus sp. FJAT-50079 TaxID=2833577 RepID=UPI001BC93C97|nr:MFS transporter [Bacillus sp. FJAT-50079]MBS4206970.1 MFS transporter [Bacillus sp. FJAT-50079]
MFRLSIFFFLLFSAFSITGGLMPLYLKELGLSTEQIGLQLAMGAVISIVGQPFFGFVSDKIQSTKRVLIVIMFAALAVSFFYFSVQSSFLLLILFMTLNLFASSTGPLTENLSITYSQRNNKNYGAIRLWGDVGVGTGSVVFGFLIGVIGLQHLGKMYAIILILTIIVSFFLQDGRKTNAKAITLGSIHQLFKNREYMLFLSICLLIFMTHRMNDSLLTVYISDLGATELQVGVSWMVATFSTVPLFIIVGKLLTQYKELTLIFVAAVLYCVRWFLYSLFNEPIAFILLQAMHGITFPIFIVAAMFFVTRIVPEEIAATGQTIFIAVIVGLGGLIGSGGGGYFMSHFGASATYLLGASITAVGSVLCLLTVLSRRSRQMNY